MTTVGLPVVGVFVAALRRWLRVEESPPAPPTPASLGEMPATAAGQLEMARTLVAELMRDRDETKAELLEAQATVSRLTRRVEDQDRTIAQLQELLAPRRPSGHP